MGITVTLTEKEILEQSNNYLLGEYARKKYWEQKDLKKSSHTDDEHFFLDIAPDGTVKKLIKPWTCSICGKDTSEIDYDYLLGYDHLGCVLENDPKMDEKDVCVICGKETPYLRSTHIDLREGYVEGGGQGCYQPNICGK